MGRRSASDSETRPDSHPEWGEGRVSDFLESCFQRIGADYRRWDVLPGRADLVAVYDPPQARRTVMLDAHQDTVPIDGMTIAPFEPVERDGRMWGRGTCDVKGGMAAMLAAFARLFTERNPGKSRVLLSCTCDEESTALGIQHLAARWDDPAFAADAAFRRPDLAVIAEPTELDVVVAHRGAVRWKIVTHGRACHSSEPGDGVNAIYRMARVLEALEHYASHLGPMRPAHPLCGSATISVGLIAGGLSVNTVPDRCEIAVDRRLIPGEDGREAVEDLRRFLERRAGVDFEFQPVDIIWPALPDDANRELADELARVAQGAGARGAFRGVAFGTHASHTALHGVPSVVFGPGAIEQAHTKDEWIDLHQLDLASEIYYRFCAGA